VEPRATAVNAEVTLLLLGFAFEHGFGRVKIQADALNERSRAAIGGIGATSEGIVRGDLPEADGSWRDSAVFSTIVADWPTGRLDDWPTGRGRGPSSRRNSNATVTDPCSFASALPGGIPCQVLTTGTLRTCPTLLIPPLSS